MIYFVFPDGYNTMAKSKKTKGQTMIYKKSLKIPMGLSEFVNR